VTERRLSLIRHGRSAYVHPGGLMTAQDMHLWREGYDAAGILPHDAPPAGLKHLVADADLVVTSDYPRAIETAQHLTTSPLVVSELLRETPTPIPEWHRVRMPRPLWEWATLIRWGSWIVRGIDGMPQHTARAKRAAAWLDDISRGKHHVVAVSHGNFRRMLALSLAQMGWMPDGKRRSYDHWSVWSLTR
jgi:broad specificity phosphatase PhoE